MDLFGITLVPGNLVPQMAFLGFASLAVLGSIMMVTRQNAVHSALWLVLVFFQIAGVYVLLNAPFLAALQVLVYSGAIVVLFLFVIMLLQMREGPQLAEQHQVQRFVAWPVGLLLAVEICAIILLSRTLTAPPIPANNVLPNPGAVAPNGIAWTPENIEAWGGSPRALGIDLYTDFLLPFEVASLILLVAVIGAIFLASKIESPEAMAGVPSVGISLSRRSMVGSPQEEQYASMRRDVVGRSEIIDRDQPGSSGDSATDAQDPVRGDVARR